MSRFAVVAAAVVVVACGGLPPSTAPSSAIDVVAGEGFWGSIAAQLGGSRVSVQSVVTDPNADPHEYESSPQDARAFAAARLVILNGAGYDAWGEKLLDANPVSGRVVVNVAALLGKKQGDNPHFWYDPDFVSRVADRITAEYRAIDSADASFFDQLRTRLATAFQPYLSEISTIKLQYARVPVGSTESLFVYMAGALELNLTTSPAFMGAVAAGNDPPASAVVELRNQISGRQIKVLVYSTQTVTQVTTDMKDLAAQNYIPSVGFSETLQPASSSFEDWQLKQLLTLEHALRSTA